MNIHRHSDRQADKRRSPGSSFSRRHPCAFLSLTSHSPAYTTDDNSPRLSRHLEAFAGKTNARHRAAIPVRMMDITTATSPSRTVTRMGFRNTPAAMGRIGKRAASPRSDNANR